MLQKHSNLLVQLPYRFHSISRILSPGPLHPTTALSDTHIKLNSVPNLHNTLQAPPSHFQNTKLLISPSGEQHTQQTPFLPRPNPLSCKHPTRIPPSSTKILNIRHHVNWFDQIR
ncbi:hypothetical protein M758_3G028100 [Ceratodon purpureus]|uniref:Uncharacterized protein n=1 Tax=Ceratodon purpureus TaxID=3225 RepID=A0A8T0IGJ2_CERPU|nr:hypothetical protein KC19_3G028800 [Ceratodon purpureus]KAG0621542.1 hypothetical protein M758_3G028100 [Ceratodon purpureus]